MTSLYIAVISVSISFIIGVVLDVYALIDLGSTLSYITPLVAGKLKRAPKLLNNLFEVSMPTGEFIMARRVYCDCVVTVCDHETLADLFELEMVEFDIIMGMD
ncbi:MAG: hypothetical protein Q8830_03570 [Candidatus Phytoplasma australasiaticum]|nr:hypothetical protein [Candidatus Phytoplasma australasiaticum]